MRRFNLFVSKYYLLLLPAVTGFFVIQIFAHFWGVGVTQDSIVYTNAAKEFGATGNVTFMQKPLVDFPVFYPVFLWLIKRLFSVNLIQAAPFVNGFLFALVVFLFGSIVNSISISKKVKYLLILLIVASPSLLEIYTMLWSETLFIVLLLLFFIALKNYFVSNSLAALLVAALIVAVACVTRYAGITLIATGCFLILLNKSQSTLKKILHLFVFSLISSALLIINLLRNAKIRGTFTGARQKGITSLSENIHYFGQVLADWLPFLKGHYFLASAIAIVVLVLFAVAFFYFYKRYDDQHYSIIATAFFIIYSLFIVITSTLSHFESINNRLISPAYIPFLLSGFYVLQSIIKKISSHQKNLYLLLMFFIGFSFISSYAYTDYQYYLLAKNTGFPGYNNKRWNTSAIANFLTKNASVFRKNYTLYSNENGTVYHFSGVACDALPQKINKAETSDFYDEDYIYLIWFNNVNNHELLELDEVLAHKKMTCIYTFADGKIFIWKEDEGDY